MASTDEAPPTDSAPSERAESNRANSRAGLIKAAFEEFSSKGYEAATVAGIAERAGVTTGAVYAHFSGKLDLLLATVGLAKVDEFLREMADLATLPWSEAAKLVGQGLATQPDRRTLLLLDVIVVARRDPAVAQILRRGLEYYLNGFTRAADSGVALGLIDPAVSSDDLARLLALIDFGKVVFAALGERVPSDQAFLRVADLLLQSSGAAHEAQPAPLSRVRARAATVDRAQQALREGIAMAVSEGYSLRQVGAAAGLSHERVRQMLM